MSSARAQQLKEEGNKFFRSDDHTQAEAMYTKAILLDPTAPTLYTNRAMARLQLGMLDDVLTDCKASLERNSEGNMKARYYAAQALLGLGRGEAALEEAKKAYEIAQVQELASLASVVALVLKCKKASWEEREKRRVKGQEGAKEMVIDALRRDLEKGLEEARDEVEKNDERLRIEELIKEVEDAWVAAGKAEKKRDVPDWAIDDITFSIMHDPVVTKTGKSYERASIMEHLRRSPTDPLTREPLLSQELRPNIALREACEVFLKENGWAVDY